MIFRMNRLFVPAVLAVATAGCSVISMFEDAPQNPARQVTESDYCGIEEPSLRYIRSEDQLSIFSGMPGQNLVIERLRETDFAREHLLIVGLGQKPTGGFGLTLANSKITDGNLQLSMIVRRPPADAMVTQALTTPCAVLAITPDHWRALEVSGNGLETLRLVPQDNR